MPQKLLNNASTEELLSKLGEAKETPQEEIYGDVELFIASFNIQDGDYKVKRPLIYKLYKAWSKDPLPKHRFQIKLGELLTTDLNNTVLINLPSFRLSSEAIKLLEEKKLKLTSKARQTHFENFLAFFNIQPGTFNVHFRCLYFLYDLWMFQRVGQKMLSKESFYKYCCLYLQKKNTVKGRFFCVHPSIRQHLTDPIREEIRQVVENEQKQKRKEKAKNKARTKALSRSRSGRKPSKQV